MAGAAGRGGEGVRGVPEAQGPAGLARRWNFPAEFVRGLDTASDPLAARPFCPLGASVHLAGWLADMPFAEPVIMDALPDEVISMLDLNRDWMREHMPQPNSFFDISVL